MHYFKYRYQNFVLLRLYSLGVRYKESLAYSKLFYVVSMIYRTLLTFRTPWRFACKFFIDPIVRRIELVIIVILSLVDSIMEFIKLDISVFLAWIRCDWAINPFILLVKDYISSDIPLHATEEIKTATLTLVHFRSIVTIELSIWFYILLVISLFW